MVIVALIQTSFCSDERQCIYDVWSKSKKLIQSLGMAVHLRVKGLPSTRRAPSLSLEIKKKQNLQQHCMNWWHMRNRRMDPGRHNKWAATSFHLSQLVTAEFLEGRTRNTVLSGCHWLPSFLGGRNPCWPLLHRSTQWFQLSPPRRTPSRRRARVSPTLSCWRRPAAGAWIPGVVLKGKTVIHTENTSSEINTLGRQTGGLPQKNRLKGFSVLGR